RRHATLPLDAPISEGSPATFTELVSSTASSPVREVVTNEFAAIVSACTEQLTPGQREILLLRNVQHHSYHVIGRMLGIGPGTVKSRIARARSSLRALVAQTYPELRADASPMECFEPIRSSGRLEIICA
ncbi:MAG: sigma factor-like helix-turn-helix DNA-binding protein, partial [Opitutus sp.]